MPMTPDEREAKKKAKKKRQKENKKRNHAEYREGVRPNSNPRVSAPWSSNHAGPQFSDVTVRFSDDDTA